MRTCALLYHDVVPEGHPEVSGFTGPDADIYKLTLDQFSAQLAAIESSITAPLIAAPALLSEIPPKRSTLITFDDGGASASLYVADMLERHGWVGHFFVTSNFIDRAGFLTAKQLCDLDERGHVVGSHSASHPPRMSVCSADQLDREWSDSVRRISDIVGHPVEVASVPGGYYSRAVALSAARSGIRILFNSEPVMRPHHVGECLIVGRFGVQQGVPPSWTAAVVRGNPTPRALRYLHWNGKKVLKKIGGEAWLRSRRWLIARRGSRP